ncbi:hypothetical protein B0H17DRAFT_1150709 [Mycena rosella]|uniref:Uncharacterized protein n=1 Tax=Mycena rosella TaxID=1033263 RepID=A0AAD7BQT5_MYCRO|nr:hypothetical protein B0H17DRAFT_1150709 [Mycena rosella]
MQKALPKTDGYRSAGRNEGQRAGAYRPKVRRVDNAHVRSESPTLDLPRPKFLKIIQNWCYGSDSLGPMDLSDLSRIAKSTAKMRNSFEHPSDNLRSHVPTGRMSGFAQLNRRIFIRGFHFKRVVGEAKVHWEVGWKFPREPGEGVFLASLPITTGTGRDLKIIDKGGLAATETAGAALQATNGVQQPGNIAPTTIFGDIADGSCVKESPQEPEMMRINARG